MLERTRAAVRPARLYLVIEGADSLLSSLIFTVNIVYQAAVVGLGPLELVLVGTLLEAVCFVSEVPTGIVADTRSRRLSVVVGFVLVGAGFAFEGAIPELWAVLAAQVVWGVGATFISGALQAWLVDEAGEPAAEPAFVRAAQVGQLAALVGIAGSVALGAVDVRIPIVVGGALFSLLGVALWALMPEHGFAPTAAGERLTFGGLVRTGRRGLRSARTTPALRAILLLSLIGGLSSEGFDRLWTPHLLDDVTLPSLGPLGQVGWFGVVNVVGVLLGVVTLELARRRVAGRDERTLVAALALLDAVLAVGVVAFALATNVVLALGALWAARLARSTAGPLVASWANRHAESETRATVLSFSAQVNALGQLAGGPAVGIVGSLVSVPAALAVSGVLTLPALAVYARYWRAQLAPRAQPAEVVP